MLTALHITIAILLSLFIVVQHRSSGLSETFGGVGTTYVQRRGAEKLIYQATTVLACLFFGLGIVQMYTF